MIESPFNENNIKVIIFMEIAPLSDDFEQIMFTRESYKRILDAIEKEQMPVEKGVFEVITNDDHKYTFKDIKDTYTLEEIKDQK